MQAPNNNDFLNDLTVRERKVLTLVIEGLTSKEIAMRLICTEGTIKKHREHILQKAHVKGRSAIRKFINEMRPYLT